MAIGARRPVYRWTLVCAGVHDRPEESEYNEDNQDVDEATQDEDDIDLEVRKRWKRCSGNVKLHVSGCLLFVSHFRF